MQVNKDQLITSLSFSDEGSVWFLFRFTKYSYDYEEKAFTPIQFNYYQSYSFIHETYSEGISEGEEYSQIEQLYGKCNIVLPDKGIPKLLVEEILNPFYIFQLFSITVWLVDNYIPYALCLIVMTLMSLITELVDILQNLSNLKKMAYYECKIKVKRFVNNKICVKEVISNDLVPGDIIFVPENTRMPCDAILLTGSCIVNESMLTGESIPVIKNPLPLSINDRYDPTEDKIHTLYSGTEIIQNRKLSGKLPTALVIRTNFDTLKGSLIKSILYPKPNRFKFHSDSMKFVGVLGIISIIGLLSTLYASIENLTTSVVVLKSLDLITIAVPPALPAALGIGVVFALRRLRENKIYCISPPCINAAGRVKSIVFDKTGTLTEDSLKFAGVIVANEASFDSLKTNMSNLILLENKNEKSDFNSDLISRQKKCIECMVTCHSIATLNGKFIGDPLDVEMFKATNWTLNEKDHEEEDEKEHAKLDTFIPPDYSDSQCLDVIKRFEFSSALQRMSVIVKEQKTNKLYCFTKGSPEIIQSLSVEISIPDDYYDVLEKYTKDGLRVLALAYKELKDVDVSKIKTLKREEIEFDFTFISFLVMENMIKPETNVCIASLIEAEILTVMATGDNGLTAISVGRNCGIINADKTVYLAELIKNKHHNQEIKWLKVDISRPIEELPGSLLHRQSLSKSISTERRDTLTMINHVAGFDEFKTSDKEVIEIDDDEMEMIEEVPWENSKEDIKNYEIAITGKAFEYMMNKKSDNSMNSEIETYSAVLKHAKIYARMSPDHKAILVNEIQKSTEYMVGMCGDGANDCKALKAADIGLSLSEAEASIAAPFTSKVQNISPMIQLLREGRSSLVTSFQVFKYMAVYSMIQFFTVVILYFQATRLSSYQYLYIDLFIIIPLSVTMSRTEAYYKLDKALPVGKLISSSVLTSVINQTVIQITFLVIMYIILIKQNWFVPLVTHGENITICYETTTLFFVSLPQYILVVITFSIGKPFKQPMWRNYSLLVSLFVVSCASLYIIMIPSAFLMKYLDLMEIPNDFKLLICAVAVCNCIVSYSAELIQICIERGF